MKKRQQQWRSPDRGPVHMRNAFTMIAWGVPSWEVGEAAIRDIKRKIARDKLTCGPEISIYDFFTASDEEGACVILIGVGTMFAVRFAAACGSCLQHHNGSRLAESKRTRALADQVKTVWRKERKSKRKETRQLHRRHVSLEPGDVFG